MKSLSRGLHILRALNEQGPSTVVELSQATGISRASIYRILETLRKAGYVRRRPDSERDELTPLVRSLSDGFSDEAWIRDCAAPVLAELQKQIVWPADLATLHDDSMYVRETTRHQSPLTIDRGTVGLRLPILLSATGRAYLAFCREDERTLILENISRKDLALPETKPQWIDGIIAETRRNGYGSRFGAFMPETGSIAIPIMHDARVLGCVNITFIASALSPTEAARRYLSAMQKAARQIERGYDQWRCATNRAPINAKSVRPAH